MAALTTVAAVKAYLGLKSTEADGLLSDLVERASAAIENFCQRSLGLEARSDIANGNGSASLMLRHYPVASVSAVVINGQPIPQDSVRLAGRLVLLDGYRFFRGVANVCIEYSAGYADIPSDVEQACIEVVALMFRRRDHLDVSSKSLAGETVSYITADLTPSARQILQNYRLVAPF